MNQVISTSLHIGEGTLDGDPQPGDGYGPSAPRAKGREGIWDSNNSANYVSTFTKAGNEAYAVNFGNTLSFYYDDLKAQCEGLVYDVPWNSFPGWKPVNTDEEEAETSASARKSAKAETEVGAITDVVFDPSFTEYDGLTTTFFMFYDMTYLTTITDLQYLNTANVTNMYGMFEGCSSFMISTTEDKRAPILGAMKKLTHKKPSGSRSFYHEFANYRITLGTQCPI